MYKLKKLIGYRMISIFLTAAFILLDLAPAYPTQQLPQNYTLAVHSGFQSHALNSKAIFINSILSVGRYLLGDPENRINALPLEYLEYVMGAELEQTGHNIDLSRVWLEDGVVTIPCSRNGKQCIAQITLKNSPSVKSLQGDELNISNTYSIKIVPAEKAGGL